MFSRRTSYYAGYRNGAESSVSITVSPTPDENASSQKPLSSSAEVIFLRTEASRWPTSWAKLKALNEYSDNRMRPTGSGHSTFPISH
jgi:hypothetical protein